MSIWNISNTTRAAETDALAVELHGGAEAWDGRGGGCTGLYWEADLRCPAGLEEEMTARNATETLNRALVLGQIGEPHQGPYQLHFLYFSQKHTLRKNWSIFCYCFLWCTYYADKSG